MKNTAVLCIVLLPLLFACHSAPSREAELYETSPAPTRGDTDKARALNDLAIEHLDRGESDKAEQALRRALTVDVMFGPAHNNLGKVYFERGEFYLAAWEFQYAIKCMPHHPEPRNNLGLVFEQADRLDQAVAYYQEARELEPDNVEILGNLARARMASGVADDDLKTLLGELVDKDTRPPWQAWAREKLALMRDASPDSTEGPASR